MIPSPPSLSSGQSPLQLRECVAASEAEVGTTRYLKRLLEVMKRLPEPDDLLGDPILAGDGGHVGRVLSPHKECLIEAVELPNKDVGLLLL